MKFNINKAIQKISNRITFSPLNFRQVLLLLLLGAVSCQSIQKIPFLPTINSDLVIKNITVIDAKNGLQTNRIILIKGNKIIKNEPAENLSFEVDSPTVIDGKGKYLLPGLWDAHVHLSFIKELTPSMFPLFLAHGVTSIRDTGGQLHLVTPERAKARKDPQNTPRVMIAGPLLDGVPTVYDGSTNTNPHLGVGAGTIEEGNKLVDEMFAAEVDLLKVYEMLSPEVYTSIMARAKKEGIVVTGHVPLSMDVIEASNLGLNSMEHLRNLEFACASDWEALKDTRRKMLFDGQSAIGSTLRRNIHSAQRSHAVGNQDATRRTEVLKVLAKNNTWQVPTLSIMTASTERFFLRNDWQDSYKYLPTSVKETWIENSNKFGQTDILEDRKAYTNWVFEMIGHLKTAKVDIMAGTDCPIFYLTPGYSLHEELALLVKGGLTPLEAIEAATLKPAQYFSLDEELGLVQEGMFADLILLDANPLEDIRNTKKINAVIRDGKLHDRQALDQILAGLEGKE